MRPSRPDDDPVRLRSATWLRFFRAVLTRQLQRSFHGVRLARPGVPAVDPGLPLVVYANHPSWWDGALLPVAVDRLFPGRVVYGPIDAEALERYRFMRRLGFFGVQAESFAGAATFLRTGRRLLTMPDTLFCLTPEGRFADVRTRPIRLQPGLATLLARVPRVTVLPLAIEYVFWTERLPEALLRFGEPQVCGTERPEVDLERTLEAGLTGAMDRLRDDAASRDPARFDALIDGAAGVGGFYDVGRRLRAALRGEAFDPAHASIGVRAPPDGR